MTTGGAALRVDVKKLNMESNYFNVTVCGQQFSYPHADNHITLVYQPRGTPNSRKIAFVIASPRCNKLGPSNLTIQGNDGQRVQETVSFMAPPITAAPARGLLEGGTQVSLAVWGLPVDGTNAVLGTTTVRFGTASGQVTAVTHNASSSLSTVDVIAPRHAASGAVSCTVANSNAKPFFAPQIFQFTVVLPLRVLMVSPKNGPVAGGTMVSIWLRDFPAFRRKTDLLVHFGSIRALPTTAIHRGASGRAFLRVRSPLAAFAGVVKLAVSHQSWPDLPVAFASWEYENPPPVILDQSASTGPMSGGQDVEIEFANWPKITSTDSLTVKFDKSPGQIKTVLWSDGILAGGAGSTRIIVITPRMETPGTVPVELTDGLRSIFFEFRFVDDQIELWLSGACNDGSTFTARGGARYCKLGSPLNGTNAGGVPHVAVVKNFPAVSRPDEVALCYRPNPRAAR